MIRVGLAGFGFSARTFHLPFLQASRRFSVVAASTSRSVDGGGAQPMHVFKTADAMIDQAELDLVVITTPNETHYELARRSLDAGRHVILDKPMVTSSEEARAIADFARERKRVLSVFQNRRFDGDFLTVRQLIAGRVLGDVRYFESHFDRFRPAVQARWRERPGAGTGLWWDLGPHLLDQALCLFGHPVALTARTAIQRPDGVTTDWFHVQLHYDSVEVVLHGSSLSAAPNRRFLVEGTAGSYAKYGLDPQEDMLRAGMAPTAAGFGVEDAAAFGVHYSAHGERRVPTLPGNYGRYFDAVADAIERGAAVPSEAADIVPVIRLLELADQSHAAARTLAVTAD